MQTLNINIKKARVIREVQKTSEYIGKKAMNEQDAESWERIGITDYEREQLDRYWTEACTGATSGLREWVTFSSNQNLGDQYDGNRDFIATLSVSSSWNTALGHAVSESLTSYLVDTILAKWLMLTSPDRAAAYATTAAAYLEDAKTKLYQLKAPERN